MSKRLFILTILFLGCTRVVSKSDKLKFSHKGHLKRDIPCTGCHPDIRKDLKRSSIPDRSLCFGCHRAWRKRCGRCHTNPRSPAKVVRSELFIIFSHSEHLPRQKERCESCHEGVLKSKVRTKGRFPSMKVCKSCHVHRKDYLALRCQKCHINLSRYQIKPIVSNFSHQGDFIKTHKLLAKGQIDLCSKCHDQTYCAECHSKLANLRPSIQYPERTDRSFIHRSDFVSRHSIEARHNSSRCRRCHGARFCKSCHEELGITEDSPWPQDRFYHQDPSWAALPNPSHGQAARRQIDLCASCHEQGKETNCIKCHKTTGMIRKSPHPPGWRSRLNRSKEKVCQMCH